MESHDRAPVPVLVIGTYHMANPGIDWFNIEADDVLTEERQSEIEEVIRRLLKFEPTKVAVEGPFRDPQLAKRFANIANGAPMLRNEIDQLGIRLALAAEHSEIYGIDVQDVFFDPELETLAAKTPEHQASWTALQNEGREVVEEISRFLQEHSVLETLRYLNSPEALRQNLAAYLDLILPIFEPENYVGPDVVGNWYRRNLRIFANLTSIASNGDRIVVFYGQGHAPLLSHFISVSTRFILADPLECL